MSVSKNISNVRYLFLIFVMLLLGLLTACGQASSEAVVEPAPAVVAANEAVDVSDTTQRSIMHTSPEIRFVSSVERASFLHENPEMKLGANVLSASKGDVSTTIRSFAHTNPEMKFVNAVERASTLHENPELRFVTSSN